MCTLGATRAARAWSACARPISPPSAATAALFDMFWGLKGADRVSAVGERSQEPGGEDGLSDIRARPLQHDRPSGHQYSMPSWVFTPALK